MAPKTTYAISPCPKKGCVSTGCLTHVVCAGYNHTRPGGLVKCSVCKTTYPRPSPAEFTLTAGIYEGLYQTKQDGATSKQRPPIGGTPGTSNLGGPGKGAGGQGRGQGPWVKTPEQKQILQLQQRCNELQNQLKKSNTATAKDPSTQGEEQKDDGPTIKQLREKVAQKKKLLDQADEDDDKPGMRQRLQAAEDALKAAQQKQFEAKAPSIRKKELEAEVKRLEAADGKQQHQVEKLREEANEAKAKLDEGLARRTEISDQLKQAKQRLAELQPEPAAGGGAEALAPKPASETEEAFIQRRMEALRAAWPGADGMAGQQASEATESLKNLYNQAKLRAPPPEENTTEAGEVEMAVDEDEEEAMRAARAAHEEAMANLRAQQEAAEQQMHASIQKAIEANLAKREGESDDTYAKRQKTRQAMVLNPGPYAGKGSALQAGGAKAK